MGWMRKAKAKLSSDLMASLYGRTENIPRWAAIETSDEAVSENPLDPAVNIVLYYDAALNDERNDFYYESMSDGINQFGETYGVTASDWEHFDEWLPVPV